jgi:hypothetical protein
MLKHIFDWPLNYRTFPKRFIKILSAETDVNHHFVEGSYREVRETVPTSCERSTRKSVKIPLYTLQPIPVTDSFSTIILLFFLYLFVTF